MKQRVKVTLYYTVDVDKPKDLNHALADLKRDLKEKFDECVSCCYHYKRQRTGIKTEIELTPAQARKSFLEDGSGRKRLHVALLRTLRGMGI